ncbi:MAG: radical SAM protein, partial [Planctomycetaceae bacterium]|nr:radical SAM protein [Planctomycetaceae bacterium]
MSATETSTTTDVGSYFISNYPPFSQWKQEAAGDAVTALESSPADVAKTPLGLYIHIPFCRKRCKFCYFRVYTNQNAKAIEDYVQALIREIELISQKPAVTGRELLVVYFGGGTPSYLSSRQLRSLRERMSQHVTWDNAKEVTFECEPGTLSEEKLQTLRDIGITRISLGVESFNDRIL